MGRVVRRSRASDRLADLANLTDALLLIQEVSDEHDLDLVGVPNLRQRYQQYFAAKRPELFKDYFDPQLSSVISVPRRGLTVQVELTVRESKAPTILYDSTACVP